MIIHEYRILSPVSLEEYHIGQLFTVAKLSLEETGGGEGVEVLKNEPFEGVELYGGQYTQGQYTRKVYRLASKVSRWVRWFADPKSLVSFEEAWNAFPYCKTVNTTENGDCVVTVESMHLADRGDTKNALMLPEDQLKHRKVEFVDIAGKLYNHHDYKKETDPHLFHSTKTGRGPLTGDWAKTHEPILCCYKVVKIELHKWPLLKNRIEAYLVREQRRTFQRFHRELFCRIDQWHDMTIDQIRQLEAETQRQLDQQRQTKGLRGAPPPAE